MTWRNYFTCAAYHEAYQGPEGGPPNDDNTEEARASMIRDIKFTRGMRTNDGDRDTMRGLFTYWRERI